MIAKYPLIPPNNGVEMPAFGLGVSQASAEDAVRAVTTAIADGHRLTDRVKAYANEIQVGDRDLGKAAALAGEIGGESETEGGGVAAAFQRADLATLALPYSAIVGVLAEAGDLTGKVRVDASNPVGEDFKDLVVGLSDSVAEQTRDAAPTARVVKAFNTIFAGLVPARESKA